MTVPKTPKRCSGETTGQKVCRFIETHLRVPEGKLVGQPIKLADFQRKFILETFDNPHGTRRAILSCARKNSKTVTIACIVLAAVVGPLAKQNQSIVSGAMSRDQAGLVFKAAAQMIQLSPLLSELVKIVPSGKRLIGLPLNTEYRALAADGKTTHGLSPAIVVGDEWAQVHGPQSDFIDALLTSQGAHENPLQLIISTQAAADGDWLSLEIDQALKGDDPKVICHLYTAPADCDLLDERAWYAANPALGIFRSYDDLAQQMREAVNMPSKANTVRNLLLNQRVSTSSPFVSADIWKANKGDSLISAPPPDVPLFGALDLSARTDLTAFVLVGLVDGVWHVWPHFWTPEQGLRERAKRDRAPYDLWVQQGLMTAVPGAVIDYEWLAKDIQRICDGLDIQAIAYDRWRINLLQKELTDIGCDLPLVEHGQGYKDMSVSIEAAEEALLNHQLAHGMHPVLTMCMANATNREAQNDGPLSQNRTLDALLNMALNYEGYVGWRPGYC